MSVSDMTEAAWQGNIEEYATRTGWVWAHYPDSTLVRGDEGMPDLILIRPGRVLWIECKTKKGTLSEGQEVWRYALERGPSEYLVARPHDWELVKRVLEGAPVRAVQEVKEASDATENEEQRRAQSDGRPAFDRRGWWDVLVSTARAHRQERRVRTRLARAKRRRDDDAGVQPAAGQAGGVARGWSGRRRGH